MKHKSDSRELALYRLLGIEHFKRALLGLERLRGRRNDNYHPHRLTPDALVAFHGHLLYNTGLHAISILFALLYFVLSACLGLQVWWLSLSAWFMLLLNAYCILLQRYTYLRLRQLLLRRRRLDRQRDRRCVLQLQSRLTGLSPRERQIDLALLERLRVCFLGGESCVISESDAAALERLVRITEGLEGFGSTARPCPLPPLLPSRTQLRAGRLQRLLGVKPTENVLFGYAVVTQTAAVEALYSAVFPTHSRDRLEQAVQRLIWAYTGQDGEASQ